MNGRVYVPTFSNRLVIYGLPASAGTDNPNDAQVTAVANSASLMLGAVSPGEVVAIFGANLGPDAMNDFEIDETGHAPKVLANTRVYFDGIAAPLLYTSADEVGAVVPFGILGPVTQVKVMRVRFWRPTCATSKTEPSSLSSGRIRGQQCHAGRPFYPSPDKVQQGSPGNNHCTYSPKPMVCPTAT